MFPQRQKWLRTWSFWMWLMATSALVSAASCKDVTAPPVIQPEDDSSETDTTENQGFLAPEYAAERLV